LLTSISQALPDSLLIETIQTIALLLPRNDTKCKKWYEEELKRSRGKLDPAANDIELRPGGRMPGAYVYWHDRLLVLKEAYDKSEPKGIRQWWFDRRNKVQWYTFWVAVVVLLLTIIFGLIQSITGVLQVIAAFHLNP
jgi:hypothetical protein